MLVSADGCVGVYTKVFAHNIVFLSALVHILEQPVLQRCGGSQLWFIMQFFVFFFTFLITPCRLARPSDSKCSSISCSKGTFTMTPTGVFGLFVNGKYKSLVKICCCVR